MRRDIERAQLDHFVGTGDCGTAMPSALAALKLMTIPYLVGACTGRSAGFLAFKDSINVTSGALVITSP
jgi:hypothetical protein